jgi:hypothetical protein
MKKLSDYRIREENGKFYVEKQVTETFGLFKKKTVSEWFSVDKWGYCRIPINSEFFNGRMVLIEDHSKAFDTIESAKAQIIKWCEEPKKPKYHYVVEFHSEIAMVRPESEPINGKYYITQSIPPMDITYSVGMKAIMREVDEYSYKIRDDEKDGRKDIYDCRDLGSIFITKGVDVLNTIKNLVKTDLEKEIAEMKQKRGAEKKPTK